jgi:hypothetical protein
MSRFGTRRSAGRAACMLAPGGIVWVPRCGLVPAYFERVFVSGRSMAKLIDSKPAARDAS